MIAEIISMITSKIKTLLDHELNSISENKEKGFFFCKNTLFDVKSRWNNGLLESEISVDKINKECDNEKPLFIHTHILHTADPSDEDFDGYDKQIFRGFCVAGIDGIQCYDNDQNKIVHEDWINKFTESSKNINLSRWNGRNLFCDHIGDQYYCELNTENESKNIGIFNKITSKGGKISMRSGYSDIALQSKKGEEIKCFGFKSGDELSCVITKK